MLKYNCFDFILLAHIPLISLTLALKCAFIWEPLLRLSIVRLSVSPWLTIVLWNPRPQYLNDNVLEM